jgi:hypothetical protein
VATLVDPGRCAAETRRRCRPPQRPSGAQRHQPIKKEAEMARVMTLSALYVVALGTMFYAYALSI